MNDIAEGIVAGVTMASIIPVICYGNKAALGALFAVNKAIGKALVRLILPSHEPCRIGFQHNWNNNGDKCEIIGCSFCASVHHFCYDCTKQNKN